MVNKLKLPQIPAKKKKLDVECDIKQQSIVGSNSIVKEIANDLINQVLNEVGKIKCEVCHSMFSNSNSLSYI